MYFFLFLQISSPVLKANPSLSGYVNPTGPSFSNSKWQPQESLGSAPSSRHTGSPSTNDEGFASGPLDLPPLSHLYYNATSTTSAGYNGVTGASYACQTGSPHTSNHSSDLGRAPAHGNACYIPGGLMETSVAGGSRLFGNSTTSGGPPDSIPPRLTLAHDPESIGGGKYASPQYPPALLLPAELMKMKSSKMSGFIGDTMEKLMDSGRESQDKTSSSGASSGMNKDLSSMSGIEIMQVDL